MNSMFAIFQKLPLFRDCDSSQIWEVMHICDSRIFEPGEELCHSNETSDAIFILLAGTVEIRTSNNLTLLEQHAVTTIGEAGMLTGETRSATVVAKTKVTTLGMYRRRLEPLMNGDLKFSALLYRNVMCTVREKLVTSNERIAELIDGQQSD